MKISSDVLGWRPAVKIFVDEHLTSKNGRIMVAARKAVKAKAVAE